MSQLSHLKLVAVKKPRNMPAIVIRRNKLSSKLWEQIQLAKSQLDGKPFVVMKYKTVKDRETGLRKQVELPKRIKPWWFQSDEGKVCVSVKYGSWTLELAKGKPSVEVASGEALIKALESIKTAVEAGELDQQIEAASAGLRSGFIRNEVIRDLNKTWNDRCLEYIEALKSGDSFLATAKGRDFYSCNRRFSGSRIQSQVIADEIRIKNEVANGRIDQVNPLRLEELDNEGLRDRLEFLTK